MAKKLKVRGCPAKTTCANRPGGCAGQVILVLARERGAYPTMTERWFHLQQKRTRRRMEYIENKKGEREAREKPFNKHGTTVPACKACVLLLPLLLYLDNQPYADEPGDRV